MIETTGAATTLTVALALALPTTFVTVTLNPSEPVEPAVNTIDEPLVAEVIVPFVIVHAYVAPFCGVIDARRPVAAAVAFVGALIVGVEGALATTTFADAFAESPAAFVTVTVRTSVPAVVAVYFTARVPFPLAIVPPEIDHAKLDPV